MRPPAGYTGVSIEFKRTGKYVLEVSTHRSAEAGHQNNKNKCPCKGCEHNVNVCDRVDYHDHDTEIGCKAKQRRGHKPLIAVNTVNMAKSGCSYRL